MSRPDGYPYSIFGDEGICQYDEFSHDGGESGLWLFPGGDEATIERLEIAVATRGGDGCHIDGDPDLAPATFDVTWTGAVAAIVGNRREACEKGYFLVRAGAHFGEAGDHGDGRLDPRQDRLDDAAAAQQHRIGSNQPLDLLFKALDVSVSLLDEAVEFNPQEGRSGGAEPVAECDAFSHGGDLAPTSSCKSSRFCGQGGVRRGLIASP